MTDKPKMKSADDLIVKMEAEKLGKSIPEQTKAIEIAADKTEVEAQTPAEEVKESVSEESSKETEEHKEIETETKEKNASDDTPDGDGEEVDDYGNKIPKAKLYTEEEVQNIIRKRLRDKHAEQTPQQQQEVKDAAKNFEADPNSDESWDTQLEAFIEKTINKREQRSKELEWQKQEQLSQTEFEEKFTNGMAKYSDFNSVVQGKPITTSMMMAARSMQDPAAFLYAACKQQPAEIERISKIADPYAQVAEIGRLEERMKKARLVTKAPIPPKKISGDASHEMPKLDVDARIAQHAKEKIMNNRR